ncbi:SEC-C metal-binding domain-containing protein [Streptomyces sp. NTH33]
MCAIPRGRRGPPHMTTGAGATCWCGSGRGYGERYGS